MLYNDRNLLIAPVQPHRCVYCGEAVVHPEWARTIKMWKTADQINVYWHHAACPPKFVAYSPFRASQP